MDRLPFKYLYRKFKRNLLPGIVCFSGLLGLAVAQGQDSVVLDFPQKFSKVLPIGLSAWPRESSEGLSSIEIPLLEVSQGGSLLVSVVFLDDEARVVQARWAGERATILMQNLSEGVRGWNQRTIKVPSDLLEQPGTLVLESDAEIHPIRRVTLAWMWPAGVFMGSAAHNVEYVQSSKRVFTGSDFAADPDGEVPDTWSGGIWKAALQENPEKLGEGLQFALPMDTVPHTVIFRTKLLSVPFGVSPVLWVNGQKTDPLSVEVPELAATGYFKSGDDGIGFAGWREGAVVVPARFFQVGENTIVLDAQEGAYIKDATLELNFEEEGAPLALGQEVPVGVQPTPLTEEIDNEAGEPAIEPVVIVSGTLR